MIRTQVQLTDSQVATLKRMAKRRNTSMAEVIREAVDYFAKTGEIASAEEVRRRAAEAAGKFGSGLGDLAEKHDDYLAEAYRQ